MIKRTIPIFVILIFSMTLIFTTVYAGGINGPEAGLIGKASGTFTYEGKQYKAKSEYLGQLRAYLSQDSIDLTQDQADKAASLMYSNVRGGIVDGILEPIGGSDNNSSDSDSTSDSDNSTGKNQSRPGVKTWKAGKADIIVSDLDSIIKTVDSDGKEIFTSILPVKNTGFNMSGIIVFAILLLLLIPIGILTARKLNLFESKR